MRRAFVVLVGLEAAALMVPATARTCRPGPVARALRIGSVEGGRSKLGPKTTIRFVPPRRS